MKLTKLLVFPTLIAFAVPLSARAQPTLRVFDNKAAFLQATAATSLTGPIPNVGRVPSGFKVGACTFGTLQVPGIWFGNPSDDWTPLLPDADIAIDGPEELDVDFDQSVFAAGFDFVDNNTTSDSTCPRMDSTFSVALLNGSTNVGSFTFNAPNDVTAFVGVQSRVPFRKLEIRELADACEDDFFGQFYGSQISLGTILLRITRPTNSVTVSWYAEAGLRYQVQSASDLTGNSWTDLGAAIEVAEAEVSFTDTIGGQPRFYRVYATKP